MTETTPSGLSRRTLFRSAGAVAAATAVATGLPAVAAPGAPAAPAAGSVEPLRLARVWVTRAQQKKMAGFDDTHNVFEDGSIEYLLWPGDLARLEATGLAYKITENDVVARDRREAEKSDGVSAVSKQPGETSTGDYRQLADYERDMRALVKKYPSKARMIELPHRTLQKRTVWGIEIATNVNAKDGRPVFYQDGCHHGREWPASEVPIMWAHDLLENYSKDKRIKAIVDNVRNILIPVVNVDGFHFTRSFPPVETGEVGGVTNPAPPEAVTLGGQGRYVRKNRRPILSTHVSEGLGTVEPQFPHESQGWFGVDPNRNYSYKWGDDTGGSSPSAFDQAYRGTDPFSDQEAKNVGHILKSRHATAMITHHTSGNLLLWAWGDTKADAPDNDWLEGLGRAMAVFNKYKPQKSIDLYVTTGTCSDYAYGALASIGYTFEHAGSSFHPPYPGTVPAMYKKNREALMLLAIYGCMAPSKRPKFALDEDAALELKDMKITSKRLAYGIITGRVMDRSGRPVKAQLTITKEFNTELWRAGAKNPLDQKIYPEVIHTTMETGADGKFEWHVNPSTRPALTAAGKKEYYILTVTGPKGVGQSRRLHVKRGQTVNLSNMIVE